MKITNRSNLPLPLVLAVTQPPRAYGPNTVSVTTLVAPPQIQGLMHRYDAEREEDAEDRIFMLLGTLLHDVLKRHANGLANHIAEERLTIPVGEWTVTGEYDLAEFVLDGEILRDWKLTSIYSLKPGEPVKPEWAAQINIYAEILRQHGRNVTRAEIIAIGRDWSKIKASRDRDYPQKAVVIKPVDLWSSEQVLSYISQRIPLYAAAIQGSWPPCTDDERWARPPVFALMKTGQKRAVKLYDTYASAERNRGKGQYVQERAGESIRCQHYCSVAQYCKQWAELNPNNSKPKEGETNEGSTGTN